MITGKGESMGSRSGRAAVAGALLLAVAEARAAGALEARIDKEAVLARVRSWRR
jgi:hypothetical protein